MGKLTASRLKGLTDPGRYSDGDGLFLVVKPAGGRNWVLRALCGGRRRDIGIGPLKSVDLGDAREAAHQIRRQIARGLDPIAERTPYSTRPCSRRRRRRARRTARQRTFHDQAALDPARARGRGRRGNHRAAGRRAASSLIFNALQFQRST